MLRPLRQELGHQPGQRPDRTATTARLASEPTDIQSRERDDDECTETAILAGGCFWGVQDLIRKRPGVISTRVGYTGGDTPNATYRNHGNHAEAIEITFDPEQISYRDLLEFFFQIHDPTTKNRQGNDIGASYRSAIFYLNDEQRAVAEDTIADVDASGLWPGKVVTEVDAGRPLLGGRARAPGLPGALPQRLHLPLRAAELEAAPPEFGRQLTSHPGPLSRRTS